MSVEDIVEIMRERGASEEDISDALAQLGLSLDETTSAGGIAVAAQPMGKMIKRKK
jgi:hypothetical protein